jgi:hypothetical protein
LSGCGRRVEGRLLDFRRLGFKTITGQKEKGKKRVKGEFFSILESFQQMTSMTNLFNFEK